MQIQLSYESCFNEKAMKLRTLSKFKMDTYFFIFKSIKYIMNSLILQLISNKEYILIEKKGMFIF